LNFLNEEEDEDELNERRKNYQQYFKNKVEAIIQDKDALRELMS
jgi:hypothetical protein